LWDEGRLPWGITLSSLITVSSAAAYLGDPLQVDAALLPFMAATTKPAGALDSPGRSRLFNGPYAAPMLNHLRAASRIARQRAISMAAWPAGLPPT